MRPNISFATHYLARFSLNPDEMHWAALRQLIAYVRSTQHFELKVEPEELDDPLKVFVDASWMGKGARSHHGFMTTLWSVPIAWSSRHQAVVAKSTRQADFIALAAASGEGVWIADLLEHLVGRIVPVVLCDNRAAVKITTNTANVLKIKNINCEFHCVNELLRKKLLTLRWISGKEKMAGIFTKALGVGMVGMFAKSLFG
ncbi:uncharacterized protein VP01_4443g2 [Puccinia sorghi]|uniref:Uncharacterized protein n=1 Tax=Puccinia sorghi TaxID=27349 RepID=A0A0L6URF1_9BASI|nr:uncharacterized protein VP01_4443g2 [Puccinia sorghi]